MPGARGAELRFHPAGDRFEVIFRSFGLEHALFRHDLAVAIARHARIGVDSGPPVLAQLSSGRQLESSCPALRC